MAYGRTIAEEPSSRRRGCYAKAVESWSNAPLPPFKYGTKQCEGQMYRREKTKNVGEVCFNVIPPSIQFSPSPRRQSFTILHAHCRLTALQIRTWP
jgi:hypothetical protein